MEKRILNGSELLQFCSQVEYRKSEYLTILAQLTEEDVLDEFKSTYRDDFKFIKQTRKDYNCSGIVGKKIDDFESFLLQIPVQIYAMNNIRIGEDEKTK